MIGSPLVGKIGKAIGLKMKDMRGKEKIAPISKQMFFHELNFCSLGVIRVWKFDLKFLKN